MIERIWNSTKGRLAPIRARSRTARCGALGRAWDPTERSGPPKRAWELRTDTESLRGHGSPQGKVEGQK